MKLFLFFLLLLPFQVACHHISGGTRPDGSRFYSYTSLGGDANEFAQAPEGIVAGSLNTSKGFQEFNKSVRFGFGAWTAKGIASDLVGAWKANTAVKEATKATQINANAATRQAQISADALANQPLP